MARVNHCDIDEADVAEASRRTERSGSESVTAAGIVSSDSWGNGSRRYCGSGIPTAIEKKLR
jgi:hypothetical protein